MRLFEPAPPILRDIEPPASSVFPPARPQARMVLSGEDVGSWRHLRERPGYILPICQGRAKQQNQMHFSFKNYSFA